MRRRAISGISGSDCTWAWTRAQGIVKPPQNRLKICEDFFVQSPLKNAGVAGSYGEAFEQDWAEKDRNDEAVLGWFDYIMKRTGRCFRIPSALPSYIMLNIM